jgi:hypothetical protein
MPQRPLQRLTIVAALAAGMAALATTPSEACVDPPDAYFKRVAKDTPLIVLGYYEEDTDRRWRDEYGRIRVLKVEKGPKALRHRRNGLRTIFYLPRPRQEPDLAEDYIVISCPSRPFTLEIDEPLRFFLKPDPLNPRFYNFIELQGLTDEEREALR